MASRYNSGHRWRSLRARVLAEEDACYLCGKPVDKDLERGHPMAPEVDHVIPISRDGSRYDRGNVHLAHRLCNLAKSNKTTTERPPAMPVSRRW